MHDQPSADGAEGAPTQTAAAAVLDILLEHHPGLVSIDELVSIYAGLSKERPTARMIVEDALSELLGSGLLHRIERFVFVSRAAVQAQTLGS